MTKNQLKFNNQIHSSPVSTHTNSVSLEGVWVLPPEGSTRTEPLLTNISYTFEPNTVTLIAGHTGSGKSTLLHTLAGLIPLDRGSLTYGPHSLWQAGQQLHDAVHKSVGIVFQYPERQLFAESIEKEFRYSLRPYRLARSAESERIERALDRLDLPRSFLTESFLTLSDGQKRKAAIASTIVTEPQWLLLDEPTAGIDPQGINPLLHMLAEHKQTPAGGVIVVSHDLDTFLPIADRVILLHDGKLFATGTPQELLSQPDVWLQSGVGLPSALALALELEKHGLPVDGNGNKEANCQTGSFPLTPQAMAEAILRKRYVYSVMEADARGIQTYHEHHVMKDEEALPEEAIHIQTSPDASTKINSVPPSGELQNSSVQERVQQLHPIAKWFIYILLSTGILLQHSWFGLGVAALLTFGCIVISGTGYRSLLKPTKPFLYFIAISTLISGCGIAFAPESWRPERLYFSTAAALQTFQLLARFLFVMLLGVLLAVTTGTRMMQAGLEQALSFLERFRVPVAAFTFSATLLVQFLPMLFQELDRTALIVRARGKSQGKRGLLRLREVPIFLIPFLLSMMKHAEDMSLALEARGYQLKRLRRQGRDALPWTAYEWWGAAVGIVLFGVLYVVER